MDGWVISFVQRLGYAGIGILMIAENVFPPIPSELIMPVAGFLVQEGRLSFAGVTAAGALGATLGALPLYYVGWKIGERRLRRFANRHGRWVGFSCRDIDRSKAWFKQHGRKAVFFGRLIPGVRSLISIPAGLNQMPIWGFIAYTAVGSAIWSGLLAWLGYVVRGQFDKISNYIDPITYTVFGIMAAIYVYRVATHQEGPENCDELNSESGLQLR